MLKCYLFWHLVSSKTDLSRDRKALDLQIFFVFQQFQPTKMEKSENNEKTGVEVKQPTSKRNLMIIVSILLLLVIGLSIALAFLVVMRNTEVSGDVVMNKDESWKSNDD